jgi:thiosulfate dehydrogenase
MKRELARVAALFVAVAASAAACDGETTTETRTAVEHGEVLFGLSQLSPAPGNELACIHCHDAGAQHQTGGSLAGATSRPSYWGGSELTLLGAINHCRYYFMLADTPWTGEELEARAIYAYLESLPGDGTAVPFSLGLVADPGPGDAGRGKAVYETACASCHGAKGTGEGAITPTAPVLPDETLAAHPAPTYDDADRRLVFVQKTRHGTFLNYGGQMPPFSLEVLSDSELADLLTYLGVP